MKLEDVQGRNQERDLEILNLWKESELSELQIAEKFNLSQRRVQQIVELHKDFVKPDKEWEKTKQIHRVKYQINKKLAQGKLSHKDIAELEKLLHDILSENKGINLDNSQHKHITVIWEKGNDAEIRAEVEAAREAASRIR